MSFFVIRNGAIQAPPFEQLTVSRDAFGKIVNPSIQTYTAFDASKQQLLWDPFFINFFPEGEHVWITDATSLTGQALTDQTNLNQAFTEGVQYFKRQYEAHLNAFKAFLDDNQNADILTNFNTGNDTEKKQIWVDYLKRETDIYVQARTVYLWIIIDLVHMINRLRELVYSRGSGLSVFKRAKMNAVNLLGNSFPKKNEYHSFPMTLILKSDIVSDNGQIAYNNEIYKAYMQKAGERLTQKSSELNEMIQNVGTYNHFVNSIVQDLEGLLAQME